MYYDCKTAIKTKDGEVPIELKRSQARIKVEGNNLAAMAFADDMILLAQDREIVIGQIKMVYTEFRKRDGEPSIGLRASLVEEVAIASERVGLSGLPAGERVGIADLNPVVLLERLDTRETPSSVDDSLPTMAKYSEKALEIENELRALPHLDLRKKGRNRLFPGEDRQGGLARNRSRDGGPSFSLFKGIFGPSPGKCNREIGGPLTETECRSRGRSKADRWVSLLIDTLKGLEGVRVYRPVKPAKMWMLGLEDSATPKL
ncbi:glutathione s-transferase [Lasius niger]|uniref:Glutathione s-transferase n=1 Tax=Lasius niger TaxID=67767 RepID=A0A0J7NI02_LASNI|nr:glutathione s-transferase [Lasius niger]